MRVDWFTFFFVVDDNSDTIACYLWQKELLDDHIPLKLGDAVRVYGRIETGPEGRRIATSEIRKYRFFFLCFNSTVKYTYIFFYVAVKLDDPNEELSHSVQTMVLDSEYKKPYELPEIIEDNKEMLIEKLAPKPKPKAVECDKDMDKDSFTKAVLQFLKDNSKRAAFMISLPKRDAQLIAMAKKIISEVRKPENFTTVFSKIIIIITGAS